MKQILISVSLLRRLRNAEHSDFYDRIVDRIVPLAASLGRLLPVWNSLHQCYAREDRIYKRNLRQEDNTRLINEANAKRHVSYMALKRTVDVGLYSADEATRKAAVSLTAVLDNFRGITSQPMTEISALIVNLIQDLKKESHAGAVALVGVGAVIERLQDDNAAFMTLYTERTELWGSAREEGSLLKARRQTDKALALFADAVNIFYRVNEMSHPKDPGVSATLGNIIHFVNAYYHQHETIYARRRPNYRSTGDDNAPGTPGEETPVLLHAGDPEVVVLLDNPFAAGSPPPAGEGE
jgi:hypothetical protein